MSGTAGVRAAAMMVLALTPSGAMPHAKPDIAKYHMVWHDEFDTDGVPDPVKWDFEQGFVRNGEEQWYRRDNVRVEHGVLIIEAQRDPRAAQQGAKTAGTSSYRNLHPITSGSVTTAGRASWTYGRFEIRARFKAQTGLWPALWFVGDKGPWPGGGEIDLFEYYQGRILANFAWESTSPGRPTWMSRSVPLASIAAGPDWDSKFHTWVMEWDARQITLSLDGRELNRLDLGAVANGHASGIDNPFQHPQHLIMNLALGGTRGGATSRTRLPSRFEIDYVRIYQRSGAEG